jgi:integrase
MKRIKTEYPGVFYRLVDRIGGKGQERVYYVVFKRDGKLHEEKAGRQYADDMTPARAARIRADLIEGRRQTRPEKRAAERATKDRWTVRKLWTEYQKHHPALKGLAADASRFRRHIEPALGAKEPAELVPLDVDRIRLKLLKTMKPKTVGNVLELLRRLIGFAEAKQLCPTAAFRIEMPEVNNLKTEDLDQEQMGRLLRVLREGTVTAEDGTTKTFDPDAREAMLLALCSGMRRGEIFRLTWEDVDFTRGFITIRDPKGGTDQTIPMNDAAHDLLKNRPRKPGSPYVFPGRKKGPRVDAAKHFRAIRDAAGLPKDFRPMHGLRHVYASHLASSGEVDLYVLQRLLTHKSPGMTQRYAHLRDETLRAAANVAGTMLRQTAAADKAEAKRKAG